MNLLRNSDAYKAAKKIPRDNPKKRQKAFGEARKQYRYSDYDLQAYATLVSTKSTWISEKLDSNTQQTLATRAFKASERVLFGRAKKVRYKVPARFKSVEGKTNKQGIRWKDNQLVWGKLELTPIIDWDNLVILHGLTAPVKYVRLLWRELNGKRRWYVQLVNEGVPYQKEKNFVSDGVVGLDLNISNIAFVGDSQAGLLPFAEGVPKRERERERERGKSRDEFFMKIDELCLIMVIDYHEKSSSSSYLSLSLSLSLFGWQKRYGKAIAAKSPGFVQSELKRKAESAGGSYTKFSTQKTALSQTHLNGGAKRFLLGTTHQEKTLRKSSP